VQMEDLLKAHEIERGMIAELYREYEHILWSRKLRMRAVSIALFDSETNWGRWDPLTRTILISRKLVHHHSWFYVKAILRHEMAHQWVSECYGEIAAESPPHGEFFARACEKLGVLKQFSKASSNLLSSPLDWREEKRDETSEKLFDKVRKLLALATSANEHEALLAMNKVRELYAKYNLEQVEASSKSHFAHLNICHGKKRIESFQYRMVSILVEHFFVKAIYSKLFDPKIGSDHQAVELIGTRENVLMAEYVYHFLLHKSESLVKDAMKKRQSSSRMERKSFRLGILEGFSEKLRLAERSPTPVAARNSSDTGAEVSIISKAMKKFREDGQLEGYMDEIYPRLKSRGVSTQRVNGDAYLAGKTVGREITLNKPIASSGGNLGRLLFSGSS